MRAMTWIVAMVSSFVFSLVTEIGLGVRKVMFNDEEVAQEAIDATSSVKSAHQNIQTELTQVDQTKQLAEKFNDGELLVHMKRD